MRKRLHERVEVLYEDQDLIVIEKGAGVLSYPVEGKDAESAIRLIRRYWRHQGRVHEQLYLLHRLDQETSGLMVFAKSSIGRSSLQKQFEEHSLLRGYLAVTDGVPHRSSGKIHTFLGRNLSGRRGVTRKGRTAITRYEVLLTNRRLNRALVRCYLHTGRTHQVRIHMGHLQTPVIGDPLYGRHPVSRRRESRVHMRLALHAEVLGFLHPRTGLPFLLRSSLPFEVKELLGSRGDCVNLQPGSFR